MRATTSRCCAFYQKNNILFSFLTPYFAFNYVILKTNNHSECIMKSIFLFSHARLRRKPHPAFLSGVVFQLHPTLPYILYNGYTPPEGNSSSSDKENLMNNNSHFCSVLGFILTFLNMRYKRPNFIKKEKLALE